ncbi:MAG TPA: TIGR03085 family metal-binding protein, partial [Acidimicrobiales bacterium]|nr:TIGR03085 family metal-binding protein [Acidimicrobiales bacterium]
MPTSHLAHSERAGLCDLLSECGPQAPTLCEGWLTKDLAAHLFVRERRPLAMPGILLGGPAAKLTDLSMEAALRVHGYAGLVAKLRSGPPMPFRPFDEATNLVEYFVHTEDVRRAAPGWEPRNDPQLDAALWANLGRGSRMLTRKVKGAGLDLERPDGERIVARREEPRAVLSGGVQEIVLFLLGRNQVAKVSLSGSEQAQRAV